MVIKNTTIEERDDNKLGKILYLKKIIRNIYISFL